VQGTSEAFWCQATDCGFSFIAWCMFYIRHSSFVIVIKVFQNLLTSLKYFLIMVFTGIICLLLLRWLLGK